MPLSTFAKVAYGAGKAAPAVGRYTSYLMDIAEEDREKARKEAERMRKKGEREEVIRRYLERIASKKPAAGAPEPAEAEEIEDATETIPRETSTAIAGEAMGKKIWYIGDTGTGCSMKLTMNLHLNIVTGAFAETLVFGAKAGLDPGLIVEILNNSIFNIRNRD